MADPTDNPLLTGAFAPRMAANGGSENTAASTMQNEILNRRPG